MNDITAAAPIAQLTAMVEELRAKVDELDSREQIREVIGRYSRAIDRCDHELLMSCYHSDAVDEHGFFRANSAQEFADRAIPGARDGFVRTFYSMGTILIDVRGDKATAETYCISSKILHQPDDDGKRQLRMSGVRFLDRFERRNGEWRIAHRRLMGDWGFYHPTPTKTVGSFTFPPDHTVPPLGPRDRSDPVYSLWTEA